MTNRFNLVNDTVTGVLSDYTDNGNIMTKLQVLEELNTLHNDKQTMIKEFAKTIRTYEEWISNLKEENRQLIKKVDMLERIIDGDLE